MATLEETIMKRKVMETYVVVTTMTKKEKIPCQKKWRMKMATLEQTILKRKVTEVNVVATMAQ